MTLARYILRRFLRALVAVFLVIALLLLLWPFLGEWWRKRRQARVPD